MAGAFTTKLNAAGETSVLYGKCSNNWIYIMQIPISQTVGDIQKMKALALILTAIVSSIAVLIGIWVDYSISLPIDHIRRKTKLVEQGDLTAESKYVGEYEIGHLSKSFNHMTQNVRGLIDEVEKVVEKVSSRTNEINLISNNSS